MPSFQSSYGHLDLILFLPARLADSRMTRVISADDCLVMHKIDRSSRNYADWARLEEIAHAGIKIFFAADSLDFDTRGGRLLADIQMLQKTGTIPEVRTRQRVSNSCLKMPLLVDCSLV